MDRSFEQQGGLNENRNNKVTYTWNQKESVERRTGGSKILNI